MLRQQRANDFAVHIRQSMVASLKTERQSSMVHSQEMQHRRMQIVNLNRISYDIIRKTVANKKLVACKWMF